MPNGDRKSRPDYESARGTIRVAGVPSVTDPSELERTMAEPEGTRWDQSAPSGPPTPAVRPIPQHLKSIFRFFDGIIQDESLLVDLCLERCMEIVRRNVESKLVGADHFAGEGQGGNPFTPVNYAAIAGPLAIELYKQVLSAVEGREEEYKKLLEEATRERERNSPSGPRIFTP